MFGKCSSVEKFQFAGANHAWSGEKVGISWWMTIAIAVSRRIHIVAWWIWIVLIHRCAVSKICNKIFRSLWLEWQLNDIFCVLDDFMTQRSINVNCGWSILIFIQTSNTDWMTLRVCSLSIAIFIPEWYQMFWFRHGINKIFLLILQWWEIIIIWLETLCLFSVNSMQASAIFLTNGYSICVHSKFWVFYAFRYRSDLPCHAMPSNCMLWYAWYSHVHHKMLAQRNRSTHKIVQYMQ